jgi:formylmethanofuran dehydrogenase subunit E
MKIKKNQPSNKEKFMATLKYKTIKCSVCGEDIVVLQNFPFNEVVCDECD